MADEPPIVCQVCGTPNPPTATDCKQCGIKLAGARKGAEVERLLNELITPAADEKEEADEGEEGGLDLDKEIVDELLDSLLVETAAPEAAEAKPAAPEVKTAEVFECPMCGADVAADAPECPSCHTKFAATATSAEPEAPAEAPAGVAPVIAGSVPIREVNSAFGLELGEQDYTTIGGFLFGAIGRLPRPGDQVAVKGAVFEIVEVEGRRVGTVRVLRRGSGAEA